MVTLADIRDAAEALQGKVFRTPLVGSEFFSKASGAQVHLKLENLQRTGSFKLRGATYKLLGSLGEIRGDGVVAASAGNHAQGVALAARNLGLKATIVMPETASISKQLATRGYGGNIILHGQTVAESLPRAQELAQAGSFFIHPFDDDRVIAGQGTVGLEILSELEQFDEAWVPVGGGGLIAGIAVALKETRPAIRVVGVQASACPSALEARRAGQPVSLRAGRSLADGIAVERVGSRTFEILDRYVDEILTVEEEEIGLAMLQLLERKKLLAEGAGAVPLAALLSANRARVRGRRIVLVVSGGNVDLNVLDRVVEKGLIRTGRIMRFGLVLRDVPGSLSSLLKILSREKANILVIDHDRHCPDLPIGDTRVDVEIETRGQTHNRRIWKALRSAGFRVVEVDSGEKTGTPVATAFP